MLAEQEFVLIYVHVSKLELEGRLAWLMFDDWSCSQQ